jgi:hypothetical protein
MDASSDDDQPTDANQPGDHSVLSLARIEPAFEKAGQGGKWLVDKLTVRQWPDLLKQQDGKQGKQAHPEVLLGNTVQAWQFASAQ